MEGRGLENENSTGNFKNHWTKERLICTHSDAFSMPIPNMSAKCDNFESFGKNCGKKDVDST